MIDDRPQVDPKKMQVVIAMSGKWRHMERNGKERLVFTFLFSFR